MSLRYDLDAVQYNYKQNVVNDDGSIVLRPGIYSVRATEDVYINPFVNPAAPPADGMLVLATDERFFIEVAVDGTQYFVVRATANATVTTFTRVVR